MPTLIKMSAPGWEKEFESDLDLFEELWDWVCRGCLEEFRKEYKHLPANYGDLLSTPCGCEFFVEE